MNPTALMMGTEMGCENSAIFNRQPEKILLNLVTQELQMLYKLTFA
jgi:hypothetical protein